MTEQVDKVVKSDVCVFIVEQHQLQQFTLTHTDTDDVLDTDSVLDNVLDTDSV